MKIVAVFFYIVVNVSCFAVTHETQIGGVLNKTNVYAKTGGFINYPMKPPYIYLFDTQSRIPEEIGKKVAESMQSLAGLPVINRHLMESIKMVDLEKYLTETNCAAIILLCDCDEYPPMLIAPEARWAIVNVSALIEGNISEQQKSERIQKELWRAFGYLLGAANSMFEHCVLKPVFKPEDLDKIKIDSLCPEPFPKIREHSERMGIKPVRKATYRIACMQGWAPMPTNSIQKAIWEEVKAKKAATPKPAATK